MYPHKEFSDFLQKITQEGYEIEGYAQTMFPNGVRLPPIGESARTKTQEALTDNKPVLFQATILSDDGLFAQPDILERNSDGSYSLYEVKSSTKIKKSKKHNHIKDVCFQKIACEKMGLNVSKAFIIHTNKEYVRDTEVNPHKLLKKIEVTEAVKEMHNETVIEVANACSLLQEKEMATPKKGCPCLHKTRANHCDAFEYFNEIPKSHTVWEIGNIREKKLCEILEQGIQEIKDITEGVELNERQQRQVQSVMKGGPIIDKHRIAEMLSDLIFPLYFIDYETAMSAVPKIIGTKPWQQIPFQFSIHILEKDGTLEHEEFVSDTFSEIKDVPYKVCNSIGKSGSVISWHAQFEKGRNEEMMEMYSQYSEQIKNINERMFDLEDVFKEAYTDGEFCGSASIKKVLPILCPHLSYGSLQVQDGTQAMEQWFKMTSEEIEEEEKSSIKNNLLEYCKMDTFAMVEIYRTLLNVIR